MKHLGRLLNLRAGEYVSRDMTAAFKGVAIVLMLTLHLFSGERVAVDWAPLLRIGGEPLCWWLARFASICVSIFMIVSGYGLWIIYSRSVDGRMHNVPRVGYVLLMVTLVGLVCYPWSAFVPRLGWTFGPVAILSNLIGYDPYNREWWFLFPWMLVIFSSPLLFRAMNRYGALRTLLVTTLLYCVGRFLIYRYSASLNEVRPINELCLGLSLLLPFALGAWAARSGLIAAMGRLSLGAKSVIWLVLLAVAAGCIFLMPIGLLDCFIALLTCLALSTLRPWGVWRELGRVSGEMWLCHTFFCFYYLPALFREIRHPALSLAVLLLLSYVSAVVLHYLYVRVKRLIASV